MTDVPISQPSPLMPEEHMLLSALLSKDFPDVAALREQLPGVGVTNRERTMCCITLSFAVDPAITARYTERWRVPIIATGYDDHGQPLDIMLHVIDGTLNELDIIGHLSQPVGAIEVSALKYQINVGDAYRWR